MKPYLFRQDKSREELVSTWSTQPLIPSNLPDDIVHNIPYQARAHTTAHFHNPIVLLYLQLQQLTISAMIQRLISSARTVASCCGGRLPSKFRPPYLPPTINSSQIRWHGDGPGPDAPTVNITFINPDDSQATVAARVGEILLRTAHRTGIEMEGACEGVCACSTCHVILEQDLYDRLIDEMEDEALSEDEEDMLDMAFGLTHTSRLGCQITVKEDMEGAVFALPKATRNFYVDGHKPTPH